MALAAGTRGGTHRTSVLRLFQSVTHEVHLDMGLARGVEGIVVQAVVGRIVALGMVGTGSGTRMMSEEDASRVVAASHTGVVCLRRTDGGRCS